MFTTLKGGRPWAAQVAAASVARAGRAPPGGLCGGLECLMSNRPNNSSVNQPTLVLSPHIDDEVLGCHSFLAPGTKVCYFGVEDRPTVSAKERLRELKRVARDRGFTWELLNFTVNSYRCSELISPIERAINQNRPFRILIPYPSYNQDHRAVYEAALTALRPHDRNWFVPVVLVYEEVHVVVWPRGVLMEPNYFVPLELEQKLRTYRLYRSQVRGHRAPDLVAALARLRGAQANLPYAEAFVCKRFVAAAQKKSGHE